MGGATPITEYFSRAKYAYKEFFVPHRNANYMMYPAHLFYAYEGTILILAILFTIMVYKIIRKDVKCGILLLLAILCVPATVNFIFIMVEPSNVHSMMTYSQMFPFIIFIWILDRYIDLVSHINMKKCTELFTIGYCTLIVVSYVRFDNQCYLKASFTQQQAISYFTSFITQIKSTSGYKDEYPVAYINAGNIKDKTIYEFKELSDIKISSYVGMNAYINDYVWFLYMARWCGFNPAIAETSDFIHLPEVREMPHYPDEGSIKIINETVVVKF